MPNRIVALAVLAVAGILASGADAGPQPGLRLVKTAPVTVAGTGFVARERVRVTLWTGRGTLAVRTVDASASGSFRTSFGLVAIEPCRGALVIGATGSRGSRATWKRACRPPSWGPPRVQG